MTPKFDNFIKIFLEERDFSKLPDRPPYGFWINPVGEFFEVKYQGHDTWANNFIKNNEEWFNEFRHREHPDFYFSSDFLKKKKFVRVQIEEPFLYFSSKIYSHEGGSYNLPITSSAKRTVHDIASFYNLQAVG